MADFGQLRVILGLESAQFKAGLADAKNGLAGWRDETNKNTGEMAKWGAAIALTAAPLIALGYELSNLTNQAAQFGKQIKDNARDLGLSTEQYQRWTHAAIAAGSSAEEITGSIRMLSLRLKDAVDPASDVSRYLTAMGVSAVDAEGNLRPMNAVLMDIIPALNAIPEGMERNQASMVLFGRSFANIADLTSLTRDELQKLMDQAPVFSDDKIQKMDDMAVEMALLNEQIQIMSVDLGEDLIPLAQDMIEIFQELGPLIKGVAGTLHEAATGTTMMVQGLQLLYTQWKYGMDSPEMKALQARVQAYAESESNERSGYQDMTSAGYADARKRMGKSLNIAPKPKDAKSDPNTMSSFEILAMQTDMDTLNKVTIPEQKLELKTLKESYAAMGDHGSEAAKKVNREITKLTNDITGNVNKIAEMTDKLTKAGASVTATGGATYNSIFASSLRTGGVGPDWGGYSDLANMSPDELRAVVARGELGGSKESAFRAQGYLDRMGKAGGAATGAASKAKDPINIDTETGKSADKLTTKLTDAYTTRKDAFAKYGEEMVGLYITQEQQDLIHWTAQTEMMRISLQNMGDAWREYVTFAAQFPTIHNIGIVVWDKKGPDWSPESNPVFMQSARMASMASQELVFKSADFSSIKFSKTNDKEKSGTTVNQDITIINNGVKSDAEGMNKSFGKLAALGGALP